MLLEFQKHRESNITITCVMQRQSHVTYFFYGSLTPLTMCQGVTIEHAVDWQQRIQQVPEYNAHGGYHHQILEIIAHHVWSGWHTDGLVKFSHSIILPYQPTLDTESNHHYCHTYIDMHFMLVNHLENYPNTCIQIMLTEVKEAYSFYFCFSIDDMNAPYL